MTRALCHSCTVTAEITKLIKLRLVRRFNITKATYLPLNHAHPRNDNRNNPRVRRNRYLTTIIAACCKAFFSPTELMHGETPYRHRPRPPCWNRIKDGHAGLISRTLSALLKISVICLLFLFTSKERCNMITGFQVSHRWWSFCSFWKDGYITAVTDFTVTRDCVTYVTVTSNQYVCMKVMNYFI